MAAIPAHMCTCLQDARSVKVNVPGLDWDIFIYNPSIMALMRTQGGLVAMIVVMSLVLSGEDAKEVADRWQAALFCSLHKTRSTGCPY